MPSFKLPNVITSKDLITWDLFPVKNSTVASTLILLQDLEASDDIINFLLRNIKWTGYYYNDVDNKLKIGYNLKGNQESPGLTEADAFNLWIADFKDKERKFKKQMTLDTLSQSQYDGLLSLFYLTGDFYSVGTDTRKFQLREYIENRKWEYISTALTIAGGNQRPLRQSEGKIIMLADYGLPKARNLIKEQSLQELVKRYPNRFINEKAKAQAEYVYFAETQRFLPNMSESRKRLLANLLK